MKHRCTSFDRASLLIAAFLGCISFVQGQCDGVCVALAKCKNSFGGMNIIDLRVGNSRTETQGECDHYLEVCCDDDNIIEGSDGTSMEIEYHDFDNCGYRNPDGVGFRITHAHNETEFGEFPWMVAILEFDPIFERDKSTFICGGSLVAPNVVLTAAHCVKGKNAASLTARAGEWDTRTQNEIQPHQEQQVHKIIINPKYPKYKPAELHNDVALLVLKNSFRADKHIKLICLPPQGMQFFNDNCFSTGWGKRTFDSDSYQVILKKIQLPMVSHQDCQRALRTTRLGSRFRLHNSFVCAGGPAGLDTCTGDGGSPLVCPFPGSNSRYYQAGIVSWGIGCGTPGVPGVYVRSSLFTDWINQEIQELNTDDFFNE